MFHTYPHAAPATALPIGTVVIVNKGRLVYVKRADNYWDVNVSIAPLTHQFDNAVGWWMTHRSYKTTVTLPV